MMGFEEEQKTVREGHDGSRRRRAWTTRPWDGTPGNLAEGELVETPVQAMLSVAEEEGSVECVTANDRRRMDPKQS